MIAVAGVGLCGVLGFSLHQVPIFKDFLGIWNRCCDPTANEQWEEKEALLSNSFEQLQRAWQVIQLHPEKVEKAELIEFQTAFHVHALAYQTFFEEHPEVCKELADLNFKQFYSQTFDLKTLDDKIQERKQAVVVLSHHFKDQQTSFLEKKEAESKDYQAIKTVQASLLESKEWSCVFKVAYAIFSLSLVIFGFLALWKGVCIISVTLWLINRDHEFILGLEHVQKLIQDHRTITEDIGALNKEDLERRVQGLDRFWQVLHQHLESRVKKIVGGGEEVDWEVEPGFKEMVEEMVIRGDALESRFEDQYVRRLALQEKELKLLKTLASNFF